MVHSTYKPFHLSISPLHSIPWQRVWLVITAPAASPKLRTTSKTASSWRVGPPGCPNCHHAVDDEANQHHGTQQRKVKSWMLVQVLKKHM
eukprot:6476752-Amphidinium_carterae.3